MKITQSLVQSLVALLVCSALLMVPGASAQSASAEEPTFAHDIAPILYETCVNCHRPGPDRADVVDQL